MGVCKLRFTDQPTSMEFLTWRHMWAEACNASRIGPSPFGWSIHGWFGHVLPRWNKKGGYQGSADALDRLTDAQFNILAVWMGPYWRGSARLNRNFKRDQRADYCHCWYKAATMVLYMYHPRRKLRYGERFAYLMTIYDLHFMRHIPHRANIAPLHTLWFLGIFLHIIDLRLPCEIDQGHFPCWSSFGKGRLPQWMRAKKGILYSIHFILANFQELGRYRHIFKIN